MATRPFGTAEKHGPAWRGKYQGPDGKRYIVRDEYGKTISFKTERLARQHLNAIKVDIDREQWTSPNAPKVQVPDSFSAYASKWVAERELAPRTREEYLGLLRLHILPTFGDVPLAEITVPMVRTWMAREAPPVSKARGYTVLSSIMKTAVADELIVASPCRVRKGGQAKTKLRPYAATPAEIEKLRMELPPRYRAMVDFGCWASMRLGEVCALTRSDLDMDKALVHITKGVIRTKEGLLAADPKTEAGFRTVALPSRVMAGLQEHLDTHVGPGPGALLFPARYDGGHLSHSTVTKVFKPACARVGLPGTFAFHQLRHSGQTLIAATGASVRTLMNRAGQSSITAAARYWHSNERNDRTAADGLDAL